jgi:hypothetical protein
MWLRKGAGLLMTEMLSRMILEAMGQLVYNLNYIFGREVKVHTYPLKPSHPIFINILKYHQIPKTVKNKTKNSELPIQSPRSTLPSPLFVDFCLLLSILYGSWVVN